jgi:hypothetical protein
MIQHDISRYEPTGSMVQLHKIVEAKDLPTYIVRAAKDIKYGGYLPAGEFFEKLDDVEVLELACTMNNVYTNNFEQFDLPNNRAFKDLYHLSLLCFVLALGEGIVEVDEVILQEYLKALFVLIAVETMYREGKVEVFRENYSVVESLKPIAKIIRQKE